MLSSHANDGSCHIASREKRESGFLVMLATNPAGTMPYKEPQCDDLVPHLASAFGLNQQCQINLDPIVLSVCCFLREEREASMRGVTAQELVEKGQEWFPQRSIHSTRQEAERMARFAKTYPDVFVFDGASDTISLKPRALHVGNADPSDESWYAIALLRLVTHDPVEVNEAMADIEVRNTIQYLTIYERKATIT